MLASTADKGRGGLTNYPTHRAPANRSPYVSLRAVYPIFRLVDPISFILNGFGIKKIESTTGLFAASFCYLTNETPVFFNSAFRFFSLVWTGPYVKKCCRRAFRAALSIQTGKSKKNEGLRNSMLRQQYEEQGSTDKRTSMALCTFIIFLLYFIIWYIIISLLLAPPHVLLCLERLAVMDYDSPYHMAMNAALSPCENNDNIEADKMCQKMKLCLELRPNLSGELISINIIVWYLNVYAEYSIPLLIILFLTSLSSAE